MKDTAGVGVELRQIYSSGRRSHHPNDAPRPTNPKPNYRAEERGPPSLLPPEQRQEGEGASAPAGGDRWKEIASLVAWLLAAARVGKAYARIRLRWAVLFGREEKTFPFFRRGLIRLQRIYNF